MNNVSVEKIQEGIDYLQDEFMRPLTAVGEELIEDYKVLNQSLQSEVINRLIVEQQNKLDSLKEELANICAKAKGEMEDSRTVISQNVSEIDDVLGNI